MGDQIGNLAVSPDDEQARPPETAERTDRRLAIGAFGALIVAESAVAILLSPAAGACLLACTGAMGFLQHRSERHTSSRAPGVPAVPPTLHTSNAPSLPGRPALVDQVTRDTARAQRYGYALTLAIIDIPRFEDLKAGNEPGAMREVVAHVAERLRRTMRTADFLAQIGESRFAVTLTDCTADQAARFSDRVLRVVNGRPILTGEKGCVPINVQVEMTALQFDAARFASATAFVAAAEGDTSSQPSELVSPTSASARARDVRLLRRELIKTGIPDSLGRAS